MYIKTFLSDDVNICFEQETVDKNSTMVTVRDNEEEFEIELFCSVTQAKELATRLLVSVSDYETRLLRKPKE